MMTGIVQDQNLEKQIEKHIGCMTSFFHIFDRHQALAGKRLCAAKRLPSSTGLDAVDSPAMSGELAKPSQVMKPTPPSQSPSPDRSRTSPLNDVRSPGPEPGAPLSDATSPAAAKSPVPFPVFEFKEGTRSPWKFSKEAPRLSLDSRATTDAKGSLYPREIRTNAAILSANRSDRGAAVEASAAGDEGDDKQRRSPSVIARLMGLDNLPHSDPEPGRKVELRRSSSESRVNKDIYRFMEANGFQVSQSQQQFNVQSQVATGIAIRENNSARADKQSVIPPPSRDRDARNSRAEPAKATQRGGLVQRKSFYDSTECFPEPAKQAASIYEEIEKKLKMRGIDEPSKDLETLKQVLEALQLKGLLHQSKRSDVINHRNFVYDRRFDDSPIVVIKPSRPINNIHGRNGSDSPPSTLRSRSGVSRRNSGAAAEPSPATSPRRENLRNLQSRGRTTSVSPARGSSGENGSSSPSRRRPLAVEPQKRFSGVAVAEQRRVSPRAVQRRAGSDQSTSNGFPSRSRKLTAMCYQEELEKLFVAAEDETSTTISESSISTPSQTDTERSKVAEDYKEGGGGKSLLERCDKLLHSIAEITATGESQQPSPVSVLDSSFYREESSPSPVMKRSIEFNKDQPGELDDDDTWSPAISPISCKLNENAEDCDYTYISDILRASAYLPEDSDVFLWLEKQQYLKGRDTSKISSLRRKLIFDTIAEILDRKWQLFRWKSPSATNITFEKPSLQQIWSEYQSIRERDSSDDLLEVICGVLRKDLARDAVSGWDDRPVEISEAALDIERLIFKDLISETIRDLAAFASEANKLQAPRRKLVF